MTGLFEAISVSVGLSGKFEQLDSPSSVSDFIEINFKKTSIHLSSLLCILSWRVKDIQLFFISLSSAHSDTRCSEAMRNQISSLLGPL